jgi:hypothetical protein
VVDGSTVQAEVGEIEDVEILDRESEKFEDAKERSEGSPLEIPTEEADVESADDKAVDEVTRLKVEEGEKLGGKVDKTEGCSELNAKDGDKSRVFTVFKRSYGDGFGGIVLAERKTGSKRTAAGVNSTDEVTKPAESVEWE